jgi:starch phosphorylase
MEEEGIALLDELALDLCWSWSHATDSKGPFRQVMTPTGTAAGDLGCVLYSALAPADRPATDYTARAVPRHEGVSVPLEAPWISWHG